MNGAATNPDFRVVTHAAAQVKAAIDATIELGGQGYVFWGGREGYSCLLNTDMKRELENLGRFLTMARDYGRKNGFTGTFFIEPKPMEPSKHQYDFDAATVIGFLRAHGLDNDFKLNIEANHATLAGHSFSHELQVAADAGLLGSIDANRGDPQNGWDTDQFPTDLYQTTEAMMIVLAGRRLRARRTQLRRQGATHFDRSRRSVHRPHRRHGCIRARARDRRASCSKTSPLKDLKQQALCLVHRGRRAALQPGAAHACRTWRSWPSATRICR